MTKRLVSVTNGRVAFGEAVARVADSLSPLGAIARVVAESSACAVAIKEIEHAGRKVDADTRVSLTKLENRRREASASLRSMQRQVGHANLTAQDLRRCIVNMQRAIVQPRIPLAEKQTYVELIRVFTTSLLDHHSQQGDQLVSTIDVVLNGAASAAATPVELRNPPRTAAPARATGQPAAQSRTKGQAQPRATGQAQARATGQPAAQSRTKGQAQPRATGQPAGPARAGQKSAANGKRRHG